MNMRKIIAVLSAALLLCAAIPMSALSVAAAPGDVIIDADFNDGMDGFNNFSVADGALVLDGTSDDWANSYAYAGSIQANTEYTVTLRVKADAAKKLDIKINNGWTGGTQSKAGIAVTTEWQEFTVTLDGCPALDQGAIFTIQTPTYKNEGTVYYIDYVKVVEKPREPGKIVNGDFEAGFNGWNALQGTVIGEGRNGQGANLKGNGSWGGMLNQTIPVEAGKTYKISVWAKANANGANIQILDGDTNGAVVESKWFTTAEWTELTWEVVPTADCICINFCGGGNDIAEDVLVDDVTIAEVKVPSFDGFIYNGDFETGEGNAWTLYSGSNVSADAAKNGSFGLICTNPTGGWGGTAFQDFTVEVGKTYMVTMDAKAIAQGQNIQIQNGRDDEDKAIIPASQWFTNTEWTSLSFVFTAIDPTVRINICGGGTGAEEMIYVDNVVVAETVKVVWNADFNDGEKKFNVGDVVAEGPDGSGCYKWSANGGWSATYVVVENMDPNKDYTVTMKAKASVNGTMGVTIQNGDWGSYWNAPAFNVTTEWKDVVYTIPANSIPFAAGTILFKFQDVGLAMDLYVDDIVISEGLIEVPVDTDIPNGDFETGELSPWDNLWGSCPTVEIVEGGQDSNYALHIVSGKWLHVRQTGIAVKTNTVYKISVWAKNTANMCMLVKNNGDTDDLLNKAIEGGEEWTYNEYLFNTGDYTSIIVSLMGGEGAEQQEGTFDNILIEEVPDHVCEIVELSRVEADCENDGKVTYGCECGVGVYTEVIPAGHKYLYDCDTHCINCGEKTNPDATHSIVHVEAKAPGNCVEFGNKEYWTCEHCGGAWLDETLRIQTNQKAVMIAGNCVSDAEFPCQDGICTGCGLPYAADEEHTYDNEYDADCNVCGDVREVEAPPVEIIYGDANGDGDVTVLDEILVSQYVAGWDVELDLTASDANGDGDVTVLDEILVSQYVAGWDVVLGPN